MALLPRGSSSLKDVLAKLDIRRRQRYIKKEYQAYGLQLATELNDWPTGLYIFVWQNSSPAPFWKKPAFLFATRPLIRCGAEPAFLCGR